MIIFLHGSDGYRLKKRSREIIDSYQKKHKSGLNFFKFDCADMGAGEFIKIEEAIKNSSFFNEIKLVVLNSPFSQKIIADKIGDFIKKYDLLKTKDVVVLAVENSDDKPSLTGNKGLLELLKKPGNLVENINYMGGVKLTNWIKNEFVSRDCAIEPMALRKIIDYIGNDSYSLIINTDKLANYLSGGASSQAGGNKILKPEINSTHEHNAIVTDPDKIFF